MTELNGVDMLRALRLPVAAREHENYIPAELEGELSFEDRLRMLLRQELTARDENKIARLRKSAGLRWPDAHISDFSASPHLLAKDKRLVEHLMAFHWVNEFQHILLHGATGVGKTRLACAIANAAVLKKIPVFSIRFADLLLALLAAENDGELEKLRRKYLKQKIFIIEDWGVAPMNVRERHLLFELIEHRDQRGSLIITSQYPPEKWHDAFQDETVADSTLDRIVSYAHCIHMKGDSNRKLRGVNGGAA